MAASVQRRSAATPSPTPDSDEDMEEVEEAEEAEEEEPRLLLRLLPQRQTQGQSRQTRSICEQVMCLAQDG